MNKETKVFRAPPFIEVVQQEVVTDSGTVVPDFYQVLLRPIAVCVPITDDGKVVTLWQYKHGPGRYGLGFPGGFVDPGEAADTACRRELREETGMAAAELVHLGSFVDNGNQRGGRGDYFLALGCVARQPADSGDLEIMDQVEMDAGAVDDALRQGWIHVIHHAAAWSLARLHGLP